MLSVFVVEMNAEGDEVAHSVETSERFLNPEIKSCETGIVIREFPSSGHYQDQIGIDLFELKSQRIS